MPPFETDRLILRELVVEDAPFIHALVNDPSWLRFIGDRNVRTFDDARSYILDGPIAMYQRLGFGLWLVELKDGGTPIGLCGLIKRDTLDHVDIGFAFSPVYRGQGYAMEAAQATLSHAAGDLGLTRVLAIVDPDNARSIRLLERLGLAFERMVRTAPDKPPLKLFARDLSAGRCGS
ncbi:MAG TPA: GNAT family N-acetyltransferase [Aliidongia sp.]|uniref:GNAT family N-acetyltransferase n=1 Tax=Aliidongia sp. TaxID=1914230 RepID=UPI002DDDA5B2|nr:GNAT family N-acetyltransferase [Aliidongia sp.]HEV2673161.1 GNAT family N-acetyltransferase [Aliidongia sp.]